MSTLQETSQRLLEKSKKKLKKSSIRRKAFQNFNRIHGYSPNINSPTTFSEKLLYRKLQQENWLEDQANGVDKYVVRAHIAKTVGEHHLIPLLGYLQSEDDFDYERFKPPIILKATHGSGWNLIIRSMDDYPLEDVKALIKSWLSCNYANNFTGEAQYRYVSAGVVVEPLLTDAHGKVPIDYKFHCFDRGNQIIIQTDMDRFGNHSRDFYDPHWQPIEMQLKFPRSGSVIPKPDALVHMLRVAKKLADDYDYIRVDLYSFEGKVLFGELTFVPGNACEKVYPTQWDQQLGEYWFLQGHASDKGGSCNTISNWFHSIRARLVS